MLCVAGGKGGCGKTTTAIGLARALVERGHRPVLVDGDVDMPDLAIRLGVDPGTGLAGLADGSPPSEAWVEPPEDPGLRLVAGGESTHLGPALRSLASHTAPVIVDTGGGANPTVGTALRRAARSLLVSLATRESLEDAAKTVAMSRELDTPVGGVVLRTPACEPRRNPTVSSVEELLDAPVLGRLPHVDGRVQGNPQVRPVVRAVTSALFGGHGRAAAW